MLLDPLVIEEGAVVVRSQTVSIVRKTQPYPQWLCCITIFAK